MQSREMPEEPDDEQAAKAGRFRRRNRLLIGVGLLCFVVGVPLVSLPDGTALSVIGLSLETVAGACVISFIYLLAGDQHEPDGDEDELAGDDDKPAAAGGVEDWPGSDQHKPDTDGDEANEEH
jgi:hypothetical protein